MARFKGPVGFAGSVNQGAGIWVPGVVVRQYKGDVIRDSHLFNNEQEVLGDASVSNSISIVADKYAIEHYRKIKFVRWDGEFWIVSNVERRTPRLILSLGDVYNGPTS